MMKMIKLFSQAESSDLRARRGRVGGKDAAAMKLRQALRARYVLAGYVAAESTSFASHQYRMHRMENAPRCAPVHQSHSTSHR